MAKPAPRSEVPQTPPSDVVGRVIKAPPRPHRIHQTPAPRPRRDAS